MTWIDKINFWLYKKAPRLLTFIQQFTIIEWLVIIFFIGWLI
jgi:hypothetical protein